MLTSNENDLTTLNITNFFSNGNGNQLYVSTQHHFKVHQELTVSNYF